MANPLTSTQFVRLLDKRLREVSENRFNELPSMLGDVYSIMSSDGAWEEFFEIGSLPDIPEFNGQLTYLSIAPGYHKKIEPKEYAAGLMFERKLLDDKKYAVLDGRASALSASFQRTREKFGAKLFTNAFTGSFDFMTSEEGVALCSNSHTTKSGTSTSTGFDNLFTSALSKTSVAAARIAMRGFRNDISERIDINPDELWVPDNLADTAMEIVGSQKDPDSANNTINPQYKRFTVKVWPRLDDDDTNNWFMCDSGLRKQSAVWIDRVKAEVENMPDFETKMLKHSVYGRFAYGWLFWQFMLGSQVS
jgi:hypothetical protein